MGAVDERLQSLDDSEQEGSELVEKHTRIHAYLKAEMLKQGHHVAAIHTTSQRQPGGCPPQKGLFITCPPPPFFSLSLSII